MSANFSRLFSILLFFGTLAFIGFIHFGYLYIDRLGQDKSFVKRETTILQLKLNFIKYMEISEGGTEIDYSLLSNIQKSINDLAIYINPHEVFALMHSFEDMHADPSIESARIYFMDELRSFDINLIDKRINFWEPDPLILLSLLFRNILKYLVLSFTIYYLCSWAIREANKHERKYLTSRGWLVIGIIIGLFLIYLIVFSQSSKSTFVGFETAQDNGNTQLASQTLKESKDLFLLNLLKINILLLYSIHFHFFFLFPAYINSYFGENYRLPWYKNKLYHFYLRSIFHDSSISIIIGILATIVTSLVLFISTAAALFIIPMLISLVKIKLLILILSMILIYRFYHFYKNRLLKLFPLYLLFYIFLASFPIIILKSISISKGILFLFMAQDRLIKYFNNIPIFPFLSIAVASLTLWYAPIVTSLESIDSKLYAQSKRILRHTIQKLKNHVAILGYGDLGSNICHNIVNRLFRLKNIYLGVTEVLSTRSNKFIKVFTDLVVVDIAEHVFKEIHLEPSYEKIGLVDIKIGSESISVLGILGDCKSSSILDKINFQFADIVLLTVKDDKAAFQINNHLFEIRNRQKNKSIRYPEAVIGVDNALYSSYLEWRGVGKNLFFVYPTYLRGIAIGDILFKSLLKRNLKQDDFNNILFLGRGKQLYYILEKLWVDFRKYYSGNITNSYKLYKWRNYLNKISLISDEPYIMENSISKQTIRNGIQLNLGEWIIPEGASFSTSPDNIWKIKTYFHPPAHKLYLQQIIKIENPHIIVIASNNPLEILSIAQEVISSLKVISYSNNQPTIISGTGKMERHSLSDALMLWRCHTDDKTGYPIQQRDTEVDLYDDASEMMTGITEAIASETNNNISSAIEIDLCISDVPNHLATLTSLLSGYRFYSSTSTPPAYFPSFHSYDSSNIISSNFPGGGYCFNSTATLISTDILINLLGGKHDINLYPWKNIAKLATQQILLSIAQDKNQLDYHISLRNLLKDISDSGLILSNANDKLPYCREHKLCPLCAFKYYDSVQNILERWGAPISSERQEYYVSKASINENKFDLLSAPDIGTFAEFSICGMNSMNHGSLARALNMLLFRDLVLPATDYVDGNNNSHVFDIKYTRCYECLNPEVNHIKIIGNLVNQNKKELNCLKDLSCFNALMIRAISLEGFEKWKTYANQLRNLLNSTFNRDLFSLMVAKNAEHKIIIIYNNSIIINSRDHISSNDLFDSLSNRCLEREYSCPFHKIQKELVKVQKIDFVNID